MKPVLSLYVNPDLSQRQHPSLAPSPAQSSAAAAYELARLIELGGTSMKAELADWLIDTLPAQAREGIKVLTARLEAKAGA